MTRRPFDPLGRDGLFLPLQELPEAPPPAQAHGRAALFSTPPRRNGDAIVECGSCGAHTPVPLVELPRKLVPSAFVPFRRFGHLMRCPSCHRSTWCRVDWRAAISPRS